MTPWFVNVVDAHASCGLKEKFCEKGILTFMNHVHASCIPGYQFMAIVLKEEYSRCIAKFLDCAEA